MVSSRASCAWIDAIPGIAGVIGRHGSSLYGRLVSEMTASMNHEPFYFSGTYCAPDVGVFAGWAIPEGSGIQSQPIVNERGDVALLLAGECFADAKKSALLDSYEDSGESFVGELNGLFSGLLVDHRRRKALLFNDRYGMERVYYHEGGEAFFFASEAKALLRALPALRSFDHDGVLQFLTYGCTLDWKTFFRDINILPDASLWTFTGGETCQKRRYFARTTWESQPPLSVDTFGAELNRTLARVLPRYLASERKIGMSLTGGLDTRMIMSSRAAAAARADLVCYTFAGTSGETADARVAAKVARACGVPHHVIRIEDDFLTDFASLADRTVYLTDGYVGLWGTHEIYLNRKARRLAPVRLTGNFGSEVLRGGTTFKPLGVSTHLLHPDVRRALSDRGLPLSNGATHPVSFAAFKEIPWHLFGLARAGQSQLTMRTPYLDNDLVALAFRTPRQLRTSPTPALRVIRDNHPGLARIRTDSGLVPASRLSSLLGSLWFRPTFKLDYWRSVGLPGPLSALDALLSRVPVGLLSEHRYLHYRTWFRTELAEYIRERLTDPQTFRSRLWNRGFLDHIADGHISGRHNYLREIDTVLTFSAIERLLLGSNVGVTAAG